MVSKEEATLSRIAQYQKISELLENEDATIEVFCCSSPGAARKSTVINGPTMTKEDSGFNAYKAYVDCMIYGLQCQLNDSIST